MREKALADEQALWQPERVDRSGRRERPEPDEPDEPVETRRAQKVRVSGTVLADRDDDGTLMFARLSLHGERMEYDILLDEKGTQLAEEMDGRNVSVVGTLFDDDGWETVMVRKFRELKGKARRAPAGDTTR